MITELRAQNFKSWQDTGALQFAPLTGFFGANSSGKTSILQVLLMLKQTVEHPSPDWNGPLYLGDDKSLINLGSFNNIIHGHKEDLSLGISFSWNLPEQMNIGEKPTDFLSFSTSIKKAGLHAFRYSTGEGGFELEWNQRVYRSTGMSSFRCYGMRFGQEEAPDSLFHLKAAFENLFAQILHLGPLREHPRQRYTWKGDHPKGVGQYGEKSIPALLSRRVRLLSIDEQIPKWLQRLDLIDSYDLHPLSNTGGDYEFLVKQYKGGPDVRLTDVGFGVSQVLPVLIFCYSAPEGSILILEQPEAHLHPKVQSDLADVLIDVVKNRNVQIILESHSEHLLHRLTRRIAEEKISAPELALYFCKIGDGTSSAEKLKVDDYGNISNWPLNFFGDEMSDLAAKARAEIERKKAIKNDSNC